MELEKGILTSGTLLEVRCRYKLSNTDTVPLGSGFDDFGRLPWPHPYPFPSIEAAVDSLHYIDYICTTIAPIITY